MLCFSSCNVDVSFALMVLVALLKRQLVETKNGAKNHITQSLHVKLDLFWDFTLDNPPPSPPSAPACIWRTKRRWRCLRRRRRATRAGASGTFVCCRASRRGETLRSLRAASSTPRASSPSGRTTGTRPFLHYYCYYYYLPALLVGKPPVWILISGVERRVASQTWKKLNKQEFIY